MAKDPICPMYYNDILGSTGTWSDEEFGCYVRLLFHQWDKNFIPKDMFRLKKIAETVEKNWALIGPKFEDFPEGLQNKVMEDIRKKRLKHKEKQAENGSLGGRPKTQTEPNLNPNETQTNTQTEAKKKPLEDEKENEKEKEIERENVKRTFIQAVDLQNDFTTELRIIFKDYWLEPDKKGKYRFEGEKYFDFKKRLQTFKRNDEKFTGNKSKRPTAIERTNPDTRLSIAEKILQRHHSNNPGSVSIPKNDPRPNC